MGQDLGEQSTRGCSTSFVSTVQINDSRFHNDCNCLVSRGHPHDFGPARDCRVASILVNTSLHRILFNQLSIRHQDLLLYKRACSRKCKGFLTVNPFTVPNTTRSNCLNACHLFPTFHLVYILMSILVRFLSILGFPLKYMRLHNGRYDHRVSFDRSISVHLPRASIMPSTGYHTTNCLEFLFPALH